ncbi:MAG: substrate-binding domain-containing protein [Chthoniobacteraceae bacterium]
MRKPPARKVTIICPPPASWLISSLAGVQRYAREKKDWTLLSTPSGLHGEKNDELFSRFKDGPAPDALIVASNQPDELKKIRQMGIPAVNLASGLAQTHGVPRVMVNHLEGGRLAAQHLLLRGLRELAYFGWREVWYSTQRQLGFVSRAAEAGVKCHVRLLPFREESQTNWVERIKAIGQWIESLPRPVGIFAVNDYRAQLLMEACQSIELQVPTDVALIRMDNEKAICEHCVPALTSVSRNAEQVGWQAAALLDRMLQGESAPEEDLILEPDGVVERPSTELLYSSDPVVQQALDYMRANLKTQFNIEQLAEQIGVSKRKMEMRFRENLATSPHDFLLKLRLQQARALLQMSPEQTIKQIALECGFTTEEVFRVAFHRMNGQTPGNFRKTCLLKNQGTSSL